MANPSPQNSKATNETIPTTPVYPIDYAWLATQFEVLLSRIAELEQSLNAMRESLQEPESGSQLQQGREYYTVVEFAAVVERSEYTVREWCRLERINAEKCETGRGDAKAWKIPVAELVRFRDHGLLPLSYVR